MAIIGIDWVLRTRGAGPAVDVASALTERRHAVAALVVFVVSYAAAMPFMNTSLIKGPVALAWHGADIAYFVNFLVAGVLYGGYRLLARPAAAGPISFAPSRRTPRHPRPATPGCSNAAKCPPRGIVVQRVML